MAKRDKTIPLVVLDFDNTIVNGDSCAEVTALCRQDFSDVEDKDGVVFMNLVFEALNKQGTTVDEILAKVKSLKFVPGVKELLQTLADSGCMLVVLSDSNTLFIQQYLSDFRDNFRHIFANIAKVHEDKLTVEPFQNQKHCNFCPSNLCKGQVMDSFLANRAKDWSTFKFVVYIGDGENDFCPVKRLTSDDYVFARRGFKLDKMIRESKKVKASVYRWKSGKDILKVLQSEVLCPLKKQSK